MIRTKSVNRIFIGVLLAVFCINVQKADDKPKYNISEIPLTLMLNANAVVRNNSVVFRVEDEDDAVKSCTYAVTILNKKGQDFGEISLTYDKFREIDDFEGRLYDVNGKEIRELDNDEIKDRALITWAQLYSDDRYKAAELYHNQFPYTIEFTYKVEYDGYINWPTWIPEEKEASVQYSSYEVILPPGKELRYRSYNWNVEPVVSSKDKGYVSYFWEVNDLPPFEREPYGPPTKDQYKSVVSAPAKFKMDDYEGDLTTWEKFGLWSKILWDDKQVFSPEAIAEIDSLLLPAMDKKEKICTLYNYLQSKTRYVNINAGIGGWQPVEAQKVFECGYGDCKALSNYMIALLNTAGIKAYPVLIELNSKPHRLEESFSYNQFNHVIVCVPEQADTVWLECTSQSSPCGFLGHSTENRYGLLISEKGGVLVKTPSSNSELNKKITKATVDLENNEAEILIEYSGSEAETANYIYHNPSSEYYDKWLKRELDIPSVKVNDKGLTQVGSDTTHTILETKVSISNFASLMGSRIFFNPCLISKNMSIPKELDERKYPLIFSYPYCEIDTIIYKLPEGTAIEAQPDEINIETEYYKFNSKVNSLDSTTISYVRYLEIQNNKMPAEIYESYRDFIQSIIQADARKVVLKKE